MSSKRSELQSSFTGSAPGKGRGRGSLKERLCQSDFHYGGMSSLACAPSMWVHLLSLWPSPPFKSIQTLKLLRESFISTDLPHSQRNNPLYSLFWLPSQLRNLVNLFSIFFFLQMLILCWCSCCLIKSSCSSEFRCGVRLFRWLQRPDDYADAWSA